MVKAFKRVLSWVVAVPLTVLGFLVIAVFGVASVVTIYLMAVVHVADTIYKEMEED